MRRLLLFATLGFACVRTATGNAQAVTDSADERIRALNAVLRFRTDLQNDSVFLARCRLPNALSGAGQIPGLDLSFQSRLIDPDSAHQLPQLPCAVRGFAGLNRRVLWLESIIEVNRSNSGGYLLPRLAREYEITIQYIISSSYKEHHWYRVIPDGLEPIKQGDQTAYRAVNWRVGEFRLQGADFDWAGGFETRPGPRRPQD